MSETKSNEHPLRAEGEAPASASVSLAQPGESPSAQRRTVQSLTVSAKIDGETLQALDYIGRQYGLLRKQKPGQSEPDVNHSAAVKAAITHAAAAMQSSYTHQEAEKHLKRRLAKEQSQLAETVPAYDRQLLEELRDALRNTDRSYREMIFQVQKVGYNWNQITKIAHTMKLGGNDRIPQEAVESVGRTLEQIDDRLGALSKRDNVMKRVAAWLRP